jgi:hypothetical protein
VSLPVGFWLKILINGESCHGGSLKWSLPKDGQPGDWHEVSGPVRTCQNGFHLTRQPVEWWPAAATAYLAEPDGKGDSEGDSDVKTAFPRCRLIREVTTAELAELGVFLAGQHGSIKNRKGIALPGSSVVAWENSSVVARGNSSVEARENSSVVAWGNSSVVAWGNSSVVAWENSSVEARENSSVVAWENSSVVAWENSSVVAWGNSSVEARENSSVEARENSSVECGRAHV